MSIDSDTLRYLTPPAVGKILGVTPERVIAWIRAGKLRGINLGDGPKRPRYRIDRDDLDAFLRAREVTTRPKQVRRAPKKHRFF